MISFLENQQNQHEPTIINWISYNDLKQLSATELLFNCINYTNYTINRSKIFRPFPTQSEAQHLSCCFSDSIGRSGWRSDGFLHGEPHVTLLRGHLHFTDEPLGNGTKYGDLIRTTRKKDEKSIFRGVKTSAELCRVWGEAVKLWRFLPGNMRAKPAFKLHFTII